MNDPIYDAPPESEREATDHYADAHAGDPGTVGSTQAELDLARFVWELRTAMNRTVAERLRRERSKQ